MLAVTFYEIIVWVHVSAVVAAFGGIVAYPLALGAVRSKDPAALAAFHRVSGEVGARVMTYAMVVVLAAGMYLATDRELWSEMWVSLSMLILLALFALTGAVITPGERKAAELAARDGGTPSPEYEQQAAKLRTVAAVSSVLVLIALFLMIVRP